MNEVVKRVTELAKRKVLENRKTYQENNFKPYTEDNELLEHIAITSQPQYNRDKVLPYFIYNFLSKEMYNYVYITNMYARFSEFFETLHVSDETLASMIFYLAKIYLKVCDDDVLKAKGYNNYSIDFYETYFKRRNEFPLYEDFKKLLDGNLQLVTSEQTEKMIKLYVAEPYASQAIALLSARIVEVFTTKDKDLGFSEIEEIIQLLLACGLSLTQAQGIALVIGNRMLDYFDRKLDNIAHEKKSFEEKKDTSESKIKEKKDSNKYLNDKEYKKILKDIKRFYNPYTRKLVVEEVSSEEREYLASLLFRLGEKEQLVDFLNKTATVGKTYTYDYFKDHIEEFEFYFGEELNQVKAYMEEINSCASEEDKEYWIVGINEELDKLKYSNKLNSYEYEIRLMKGENS